jgi:protein FAM32A
MKPAFTGGALSFKGEKKKAKKKNNKAKHSLGDKEEKSRLEETHTEEKSRLEETHKEPADVDDGLTEAERKAAKKKRERERTEMEQVASKSHRERVEEFNEKLGSLTELNDIPRVSAAGNG